MKDPTLEEIELLRKSMINKAIEKNSLMDIEVIELSEQLDNLILLYFKKRYLTEKNRYIREL